MGCDAQLAFGGLSEGECSGGSDNFSNALIFYGKMSGRGPVKEECLGKYSGEFSQGKCA